MGHIHIIANYPTDQALLLCINFISMGLVVIEIIYVIYSSHDKAEILL